MKFIFYLILHRIIYWQMVLNLTFWMAQEK